MSDFANKFISGLALSEAFYKECVEPVMHSNFEPLKYSACLIGSGSEILGFDTPMSADHHWGPRVMLFLTGEDFPKFAEIIKQTFRDKLPRNFRGFPTSFSDAAEHDKGVQILDYSTEGPINHRITVETIQQFFQSYLGFDIEQSIQISDWLSFPTQKLRSIVAGQVFHDDIGIEMERQKFSFYPHDLWLYLLASGWSRIEQEEHLMGRAGSVGDEVGSAIIAARLVRDIMQICFLMERTYAPYPKWFGTAFQQLNAAKFLNPHLEEILNARKWTDREMHLSSAYEYLTDCHNKMGISDPLPAKVAPFHDRPFLTISMGAISKIIVAKIKDPEIKKLASLPLIGSVSQFSDSTDLQSDCVWRDGLRNLYN